METKVINPWLDIWRQPRATMRHILDTNPFKTILWLAIFNGVISGVMWALQLWSKQPTKPMFHSPVFIILLLIIGAILGVVGLYVGAWLYRAIGSWVGGKGRFVDLKAALGWSNYPFIVANLFGIFNLLSQGKMILALTFGLINFILLIWAFIITLKLVAEAHRFSVWKSLLALIIAFVIIFVVVMLIFLLIPLIAPIF